MADRRDLSHFGQQPWTSDRDDWPDDSFGSGQDPRAGEQAVFGPPPARPAPPGYRAPAPGTGRGGRGFVVAAAVVVSVLIAAILALVAVNVAGRQTPASSAGNAPPVQAPGGNGGAGPVGGQGGAGGNLFMAGQVTRVTSTSITLTGQDHQVTAAITSATTFSGVHSASQIKPGDQVSAQISGYGGAHPVATAIQDPPSFPGG
jgi:hypothetical protein